MRQGRRASRVALRCALPGAGRGGHARHVRRHEPAARDGAHLAAHLQGPQLPRLLAQRQVRAECRRRPVAATPLAMARARSGWPSTTARRFAHQQGPEGRRAMLDHLAQLILDGKIHTKCVASRRHAACSVLSLGRTSDGPDVADGAPSQPAGACHQRVRANAGPSPSRCASGRTRCARRRRGGGRRARCCWT